MSRDWLLDRRANAKLPRERLAERIDNLLSSQILGVLSTVMPDGSNGPDGATAAVTS